MRDKKIWLLWKLEEKDGKPTKVPYQINGRKASSIDKDTWSTYTDVNNARSKFDGVGFVFTGSMLGVDLDHVLEEGKFNEQTQKFLSAANTYVEISPSGTGLHALFNLTEPIELLAHKHNNKDKTVFECYSEGRFFTYTGNRYSTQNVRTIDSREALELLSLLGYPWKKTTTKTDIPSTGNSVLSDEEVLQKMFSASNGAQNKILYDGDTSRFNNDQSVADLALCSTLSFYCGKDVAQIERLWLASPLGSREKTQSRADYRSRTISVAIEGTTKTYTKPTLSPYTTTDFTEIKLRRTKGGVAYNDLANVLTVFENHPKYKNTIKFNTFRLDIEMNGVAMRDEELYQIQYFLQQEMGLNGISKSIVYEAVQHHAFNNKYDEAIDWLESLVWDEIPRLKTWLSLSCGVPTDEYHALVGLNWMYGMVNRLKNPGCIFDHVLTIVGGQGIGKTSLLRIIGGDWYKSHTEGLDNKDFFLKLRGACLIDLDEGATLYRSDSIKIKSVISTRCDEYRAPYDKITQQYPRRFVFSMSTNETEPFKDQTGNRRYLLVRVENQVNFAWLENNRTQLFAEAYHLLKTNAVIPEIPKDVALRMQEEATLKDEWCNVITAWISSNIKYQRGDEDFSLSIRDVYEGALGGTEIHRLDTKTEMKIGNILKNDLKMDKRRVMHAGSRQNRFFIIKKECERLQEQYKNTQDDYID